MTMAMQNSTVALRALLLTDFYLVHFSLTVNKWSSSGANYKINFLDNILENIVKICRWVKKMFL